MFSNISSGICLLFFISAATFAETGHAQSGQFSQVQAHAGKMDTDGILSEGEIPNPNIDYDRELNRAQRRDDRRLDNPYNDAAAAAERERKDRELDRRRWEDDRYRDHDRDRDYREENPRDRNSSWWPW